MKRGTSCILTVDVGTIPTPTAATFIFKRLPFECEETLVEKEYPSEAVSYSNGKFSITLTAGDTYDIPFDECYVDAKITTASGTLIAEKPATIKITHTLFEEELENENN